MSPEPQQRIEQLEQDYHSLAADVNAIARGQSALSEVVRAQGDRLERIGDGVDRLIDERGNRGWNTQNLLGALAAAATLVFGASQYIELQLNHVSDDIKENTDRVAILDDFRFQAHHEFGRLFEHTDDMVRRIEHYDELYHKMDEEVRALDRRSAAAEVSRRAIGDYAKELGSKIE